MKHIWHYRDRNGAVHEEELSDDQANADQGIVAAFQGLEAAAAAGLNLNSDKDHAASVGRMLAAVSALPKERAAHWREELKRIGVKVSDPKPEKQEGNSTTITAEARK